MKEFIKLKKMAFKGLSFLKPGLGALALCSGIFQTAQGISLEVSTSGGNASSPLMYGFMFEVRVSRPNIEGRR